MPFLPSLPEDAKLGDLFLAFPDTARPLGVLVQHVLRGPSPLSEGERELIGAYVSGLNECQYCHGVHSAVAAAFGIEEPLIADLLDNFGEAAVDQRLRPLLAYAGKLTTSPAKMVQADADAVFAKGWDERALYDATAVSALFNYLNRMVEGAGIKLEAGYPEAAAPLLSTKGYGTRFRDQDEIG